jgi:hypothetical protein
VSQLEGQLVLLPTRDPSEVALFGVRTKASATVVQSYLEIRNQLTRETATSLLHFLHYLGSGTYFERFFTDLWNFDHARPNELTWLPNNATNNTRTRFGIHINPSIFDALQQASGRRVLHLYTLLRVGSLKVTVLGKSSDVKLHYRS